MYSFSLDSLNAYNVPNTVLDADSTAENKVWPSRGSRSNGGDKQNREVNDTLRSAMGGNSAGKTAGVAC